MGARVGAQLSSLVKGSNRVGAQLSPQNVSRDFFVATGGSETYTLVNGSDVGSDNAYIIVADGAEQPVGAGKAFTRSGAAFTPSIPFPAGTEIDIITLGERIDINVPSDGSVNFSNMAEGTVIQTLNTQTGAFATGTNSIPQDDTIPQITEGDLFMTRTITPKLTSSKLKIDVVFHCSVNANSATSIVALFQNSDADAIACSRSFDSNSQAPQNICFTHWMTSGSTAEQTFTVRAGFSTGVGTALYFNGQSAARFMGGALASSITITEIK